MHAEYRKWSCIKNFCSRMLVRNRAYSEGSVRILDLTCKFCVFAIQETWLRFSMIVTPIRYFRDQ